jgi:hypothetical protein
MQSNSRFEGCQRSARTGRTGSGVIWKTNPSHGRAENEPYFNVACGAAKSHGANDSAPIYAFDERSFEEAGEHEGGFGFVLRLVQLLPRSFHNASHARDGSRNNHRSRIAKRIDVLNNRSVNMRRKMRNARLASGVLGTVLCYENSIGSVPWEKS